MIAVTLESTDAAKSCYTAEDLERLSHAGQCCELIRGEQTQKLGTEDVFSGEDVLPGFLLPLSKPFRTIA